MKLKECLPHWNVAVHSRSDDQSHGRDAEHERSHDLQPAWHATHARLDPEKSTEKLFGERAALYLCGKVGSKLVVS